MGQHREISLPPYGPLWTTHNVPILIDWGKCRRPCRPVYIFRIWLELGTSFLLWIFRWMQKLFESLCSVEDNLLIQPPCHVIDILVEQKNGWEMPANCLSRKNVWSYSLYLYMRRVSGAVFEYNASEVRCHFSFPVYKVSILQKFRNNFRSPFLLPLPHT